MQDCYKKLDELFDSLNSVCDSTGIVRTLILSRMYNLIKELNEGMADAENEWKNEKLKLEAEIQDLKDMTGKG